MLPSTWVDRQLTAFIMGKKIGTTGTLRPRDIKPEFVESFK